MKQLILEPSGWPCKYLECPVGLFLYLETAGKSGNPCLACKSEYKQEAYIVESGEMFWGGTDTPEKRGELIVQSLKPIWIEKDA